MKLTPNIKITKEEHDKQPLRVHALLEDFELEDVWRVPITLTSNQTLRLFFEQFAQSLEKITDTGVAGFLFKFRLMLGKLLHLDDKKVTVNELVPGSIRHRYAEEAGLRFGDLPAPGKGGDDFVPVYVMENEQLSEIENKTVHAALHFSRVPIGEGIWGIHMAVYVKPKGLLGKMYMVLIKPFRLWVVYPVLMKTVKNQWESSLEAKVQNAIIEGM